MKQPNRRWLPHCPCENVEELQELNMFKMSFTQRGGDIIVVGMAAGAAGVPGTLLALMENERKRVKQA